MTYHTEVIYEQDQFNRMLPTSNNSKYGWNGGGGGKDNYMTPLINRKLPFVHQSIWRGKFK